MKIKRVFITGVFGYLGAALAEVLVRDGIDVFGIDSLAYEQDYESICKQISGNGSGSFNYNLADTRDAQLVSRLISDWGPDCIVHFGDLSSVYSCNHNPTYTETVNINGTLNIIAICSDLGVPLLVNSSSSVYGVQQEKRLCAETDLLPPPSDLYCATKLRIEQHLQAESQRSSRFNFICFRPATVFGQGSRFRIELLPNHFCFSALVNKELRVADLNAYRAFIHIETLVGAYRKIIESRIFNNQIYNIGSFNLTKLEVALSIQRAFECKIITIPDIGDLRNLQISSTRLVAETGVDLNDDFDLRISQLIEWMTPRAADFSSDQFNGMLNMPLSNWLKLI